MPQENFPKVSIVIPTYNSGKYLKQCLESVKNQILLPPLTKGRTKEGSDSFSAFEIEIIVVDNNSFDSTKEIAKKYTDKVFEITNHLPLNKGEIKKGSIKPERSSQRNFGAQQANGDYLLFIDSDMILSPNVVRACLEKITKCHSELIKESPAMFSCYSGANPDVMSGVAIESQETILAKALIIPEQSLGSGFWAKCKNMDKNIHIPGM